MDKLKELVFSYIEAHRDEMVLLLKKLILLKYTPQLAGGNLVLGFQGGV